MCFYEVMRFIFRMYDYKVIATERWRVFPLQRSKPATVVQWLFSECTIT